MSAKSTRDIEKDYAKSEFVAKLRRLADALENDEKLEIQIAGERIYMPVRAVYNIEHERDDDGEEIEFQITWQHEQARWPLDTGSTSTVLFQQDRW